MEGRLLNAILPKCINESRRLSAIVSRAPPSARYPSEYPILRSRSGHGLVSSPVPEIHFDEKACKCLAPIWGTYFSDEDCEFVHYDNPAPSPGAHAATSAGIAASGTVVQ